MRHLKPVIFTFPIGKMVDGKHLQEGEAQAAGWIVPDTDETLAIDMLYEASIFDCPSEADWAITHLPTGFRVSKAEYTVACSSSEALGKARRFYQEMRALGADMKSTDSASIVGKVNALDENEKKAFWYRVAGWKLEEKVPA